MTPLQKLPKNVGDLGQLVIAKGLKKLPKVKKIAKSGHTALCLSLLFYVSRIRRRQTTTLEAICVMIPHPRFQIYNFFVPKGTCRERERTKSVVTVTNYKWKREAGYVGLLIFKILF